MIVANTPTDLRANTERMLPALRRTMSLPVSARPVTEAQAEAIRRKVEARLFWMAVERPAEPVDVEPGLPCFLRRQAGEP